MKLPRKSTLLVEDNGSCAHLMAAYCEMAGTTPTIVETIEETMDALAHHKFDLVLLDLGLPDSQPFTTLNMIPKLIALGASRIVVITGIPRSAELIELVAKAGAVDVLEKGQADMADRLKKILAQ